MEWKPINKYEHAAKWIEDDWCWSPWTPKVSSRRRGTWAIGSASNWGFRTAWTCSLEPCSRFNDCNQHFTNILPTFYQHFTQPWPIQTAAAKLRGGSSPHYTQAAAWCATHHRVARTSCLPANTAGLFFEPYPVRSPCSPWLHLTMMPCERYICVQAFLKLFSTRYIHSTSLYFGILERLPFDMFWHVLKCVDMFWLGMQRIAMSLFHAQLSRPGSWK